MFLQVRRILPLAALACALSLSGTAQAAANSSYSLTDTLPLPGLTRWDYLAFDTQNHRLFITRGESVDVLDVASQKITGSIPDTKGVHGVALAPDLGKGFTSNGTANTATIFDLKTLETLATVPTGTKPDAIVYDAKTQRVFTANGASNDVTVINALDGKPLATIPLDGKPEFAVVDGKGRLYINIEDKSQLAVIDAQNAKLITYYNLAPHCDSPSGLAIDIAHNRLFSVCENKVMVITQAETGKSIDTLPIGARSDAAAFDAGTGLAFSSNGEGTLTVIGASTPNHYKVLQTVPTLPTARTMALDPATHSIYLAAAETEGGDASTAASPHSRPQLKPDSFKILTVEPKTGE
ncbi:MAG: YncE family protein [Alphaproteobacteria bacterium]